MLNSSHFLLDSFACPFESKMTKFMKNFIQWRHWNSEKWQRIQHLCKSDSQLLGGPIRYLSQSCNWIAYLEKPRCVLTLLLFYIVWWHGWKLSPYEMWVLSYTSIIWAWIMNEVAGSHFTIQLGSHLPCYWLIPYISQFQQQQLFQTKT